jgi:hypothetical protein
MTVSTIIFSYSGGIEISKRHFPIWKENTDNLLIISPENSPCILPNTNNILYEKSNQYGMPMLKRQIFGMKKALDFNSDYYVFIEYDGIMLSRPKEREFIQTNTYYDNRRVFSSKYFHHFPWIFPQKILKEFCEKATFEPFEQGFVDRWLACQVDKIGIPFINMQKIKEGFSTNTIKKENESELYGLISRGAYAIHGIKNEGILNEILKRRGIYTKNHEKQNISRNLSNI